MRLVATLLLLVAGVAHAAPSESPGSAWPPVTQTAKPWTRWWWPGSAVDRAGVTAQLEALSKAGIGGVEITPVYGARGAESKYLEFLSPRWVEMLAFTTSEAKRLGLGVDMATGTGWPFGGPGVSAADGSSKLAFVDGRLTGSPTQMKVKRAAPGGAGLVLDPYSTDALGRYLAPFGAALAKLPRGALRAQFHDSFEYYEASWTPALPAVFRDMHGYDIQTYAAAIAGAELIDADTLSRVKGDYRRTLARLHLDYVNAWAAWSHAQGFTARNQAHGAPGNLLDLYAAADIPETESFGATRLPIPGLRMAADDVNEDPDPAVNLVGRFASSAAHVAGRPLASSETLTWLRENFREPPSAAKPQVDRLLTAGINHVFYHGTSYSPPDAPWPGWFFYAATQLKPENPLWRDYAGLHAYVGRVQSVLQAGKPDNDVLLYWPFDDLADDAAGGLRQLGMHDNAWLRDSAFGKLALQIIDAGYGVDFISDAQIARLSVDAGRFITAGGNYRVLVVPTVKRMSVGTFAKIVELDSQGGRVIVESAPQDVPGLENLEARRRDLRRLRDSTHSKNWSESRDVLEALRKHAALRQEPAAAAGLGWIRRARKDGTDYFFVNSRATRFDGWLAVAAPMRKALLMNPLDGRVGVAAVRDGSVYLQLEPGESMIVRTVARAPALIAPHRYVAREEQGVAINGPWQITFLEGGPTLPAPATMPAAASWTTLADPRTQSFSGTARYRVQFDAPAKRADDWLLDLGDVREAARVRLNGVEIAAAWSLPFQVRLGALKPRDNVLEIDVTNLPANRIRDLDRRKVEWKTMGDINLASLRYGSFDASGWSIEPSGLNGAVRLVPLTNIDPR